jgi:hypothetical protein
MNYVHRFDFNQGSNHPYLAKNSWRLLPYTSWLGDATDQRVGICDYLITFDLVGLIVVPNAKAKAKTGDAYCQFECHEETIPLQTPMP